MLCIICQMKSTMRFHHLIRMANIKKLTTNGGKNSESQELLLIAGGNAKWQSCCGTVVWQIFIK